MSVYLVLIDDHDTVVDMNDHGRKLLGEDLIGNSIKRIIPDWRGIPADKWGETVAKINENIGLFLGTSRIISYHGTVYHLLSLKEEEESSDYDQIKNRQQFIAFLSHELRNPLQSITMASRMLKHVNKGVNPKITRYQHIIDNCCRDMRKIINDVLDLHKIDAGELSIDDEIIELKQLVEEWVGYYTISAEEKGLKLKVAVSDQTPKSFRSDQVRVSQIVSNLLSNAIKYSEKGDINLDIFMADGYLNFRVSDQGIGINESEISKLFTNIVHLSNHQNLQTRPDSNGLGLLISQRIAHLLGGEITVTSTVGVGSSFCFTVPYNCIRSLEESLVLEESPAPVYGNILIVDDSDTNAELINDAIQQFNLEYGFKIDTHVVSNGLDAVTFSRDNRMDLILMDVNMEKLDGCQACSLIRRFKSCDKIVALTGNIYARQNSHKKRFYQFDETVIKPCTEAKLLKIIIQYMPHIETDK